MSNMDTKDAHEETGHSRSMQEDWLRIGDVAARTGLTQRTIRYYEEMGLLPPPARTQGEYRLYSPDDVTRLQRVVRLKELCGFSLAEIRDSIEAEGGIEQLKSEYRAAGDTATRAEKLEKAISITEGQLALIERKLGQMREMRGELRSRMDRYKARRAELLQGAGAGVGASEERA